MTPSELKKSLPLPSSIDHHKEAISDILWQRDPRWLIIVGPCSIHDRESALEYGERLAQLSREVEDSALLVLRTYFEKPRTRGGWKGFLIDPDLDGSCRTGVADCRSLCLELTQLGLPLATEFLDPLFALYINDCISWGAIGARTTASQPHRHLAARLDCPIGFKNSTHGRIEPALFSICEASKPQAFFGLDEDLKPGRIEASGNESAHLVLRGSDEAPNYTPNHLRQVAHLLDEQEIETTLIVDCSHGNSQKNPRLQSKVVHTVLQALETTDLPLAGFMLESHLFAGSQPRPERYGVSITDPCLDWPSTKELVLEIAHSSKRMSSHHSWC